MSLINKLLTDLEERHNLLNGQDEVVLDGLVSVPATSSQQRLHIPVNFILVSFFLAATAAVAYGVVREHPEPAGPIADKATGPVQKEIQLPARQETKAVETARQKTLTSDLIPLPKINSLRLATVISTPAEPAPRTGPEEVSSSFAATPLVISDVSLVEENKTLSLDLKLNGKTHYNAYTLENPDRVVLVIDNARFSSTIPAFDHIPQIKGIRISDRPGEALKLVIDANQPLSIEKTRLVDDGDVYTLNMILYPSAAETAVAKRKPAPVPVLEQQPPDGEEHFGQMSVRRSNGKESAGFSNRLYMEAIALYSKGDVQRASRKLFDVLARDPLDVNARLLLASKLLEEKDINNAEKILRTGLDIKANVPEWAKLYAHILTVRNNYAEAVTVLKAALPAVKGDAEYYAFLAALLQQESRHEEAVNLYKKVVNIDSTNGVWWMGLAISLDALNRTNEALYAYGESLKGKGMTQDLHKYVSDQITRLTTRKNS